MFQKLKELFGKNKRGAITLGSLPQTIMALVFVGAIAIGGFLAFDGMSANLEANSFAANATANIESGLNSTFEQMPTVGVLIGVGILLTVVIVGFGMARTKGYI